MFLIIVFSFTSDLYASNEQIVLPSLRTVTVSAIDITSFNLCEIIIDVIPSCLSSFNRFNRFSESSSFNAAVGSSNIKSFTSLLNAFAISTNCCLPTPKSFILTAGLIFKLTFFNSSFDLAIVSFQFIV